MRGASWAEAGPRILGRYEIQEEIGRGMMGVVYRALDPALGRTVALKTVNLLLAVPDEDRPGFEQRFLNEARIAAGLNHPGIVVVHDVGRDTGSDSLYIALEYLEGETLSERVKRDGRLQWREALRLTAKVAEALHHAHEKHIVHRDVKPANIMVLPSGQPKLMDFGIAKIPAAQLTGAGEFFGTPSYMSPEQATGEPAGRAQRRVLPGCRALPAADGRARLRRAFGARHPGPRRQEGSFAALPAHPGTARGRGRHRGPGAGQGFRAALHHRAHVGGGHPGRPRRAHAAPSRGLDASAARGRDRALGHDLSRARNRRSSD